MENKNGNSAVPSAFIVLLFIAIGSLWAGFFIGPMLARPGAAAGKMSAPEAVQVTVGETKTVPFRMLAVAHDPVTGDFSGKCSLEEDGSVTVLAADADHVLAEYRTATVSDWPTDCADGAKVVIERDTYSRFDAWSKRRAEERTAEVRAREFGRKHLDDK